MQRKPKTLIDYLIPGEKVYTLPDAFPSGFLGTVIQNSYDGTVLVLLDPVHQRKFSPMWFSVNEVELVDDL